MGKYDWNKKAAKAKIHDENYKLNHECANCKFAVLENKEKQSNLLGLCGRTRVPNRDFCPIIRIIRRNEFLQIYTNELKANKLELLREKYKFLGRVIPMQKDSIIYKRK